MEIWITINRKEEYSFRDIPEAVEFLQKYTKWLEENDRMTDIQNELSKELNEVIEAYKSKTK